MKFNNQHESLNFKKIAVFLIVICFISIAALSILFPVFHFQSPSGPHEIGTLTYHWVDESRSEIFSQDVNAHRELIVQIWYPAKIKNPPLPRTSYIRDADAVIMALARLKHVPTFTFNHLKYITTNAVQSAPVSDLVSNYPVLIFLEGANGFRQMNMFQVQELVSHGYIVVAIDQPYTAAAVVFPNGLQVTGLSLEQMKPLIRQSYRQEKLAPKLNGRILNFGIINYLAQDVSFVLNQLHLLNRTDPNGILTDKLDLSHIGIFGISLGGIVLGEACLQDSRLLACLVMDAPVSSQVNRAGLQQPTLWITRDAKTMQSEGWPKLEIDEHQNTMRTAFENFHGARYFVQIPGLFHVNLTDVPLWSPLFSWMGISGPIDKKRAHNIINFYSLAFFNKHLKGGSQLDLDQANKDYPEVLLEARGL